MVVAAEPHDAVAFVRSTDFRGGRARIVVRAEAEADTSGILTARFTTASGDVVVASRAYRIVEPPSPMPTEQYEQRELARVAQAILSSIAAIERIDAAALFDV